MIAVAGRAVAAVLRTLIIVYQRLVRPFYVTTRCRFYPSCSEYVLEALSAHGLARGMWLGTRRLLRCHPFHPGGIDEVPPARQRTEHKNAGGERAWVRSGTA